MTYTTFLFKVGGVGLTITAADRVVICKFDFVNIYPAFNTNAGCTRNVEFIRINITNFKATKL